VGDDKVRAEHRKLYGVILPANDPRWLKIWPPNGWKCRCYVIPRMAHEVKNVDMEVNRALVDAYFETSEWKQNEAQGFGVNRAMLPEVFTEDQMYVHKFPNQASKLLKDVNYHSYDLKSYEANRAIATIDLPRYEGNADDFFSSLKKEDGKTMFTDYNGRSIVYDEKVFLQGHTLKKYADRVQYLKAAAETFKMPDEVWINNMQGDGFNQYVFIKYYKDQVMAAVASIEEGTVYRVKTWFSVSETTKSASKAKRAAHKYRYRHGLLIKKPGV
jgi:hypothetical protein